MTTIPAGVKGRSVLVFVVSLVAICAELCFSLIFSLKSYSHMVYVVISFALLGYGVGSNLYLLLAEKLSRFSPNGVVAAMLLAVSAPMALASQVIPGIPVHLDMLYGLRLVTSMTAINVLVALPFVGIGFVISLIFSSHSGESRALYFWDLVGAGLAAVVFFPLLPSLGPVRVLLVLAIACSLLAGFSILWAAGGRKSALLAAGIVAALEAGGLLLEEPAYAVDPGLSWENVPGYFRKDQYEQTWQRWHPLGRTDLHRMTDAEARAQLLRGAPGVFEIPLVPPPEFSYFANNYRAGTPVYELSQKGLERAGSKLVPFSQPMECPYVLLEKPRVLVIGAGGGRDLFMAKAHDARQVVGAEINPATYQAMAPGGIVHEYSGRIYAQENVTVHNIDGRHLVRNQPDGSRDLIILNGIDTFAALSTGAYAFAENYLYTQEAIVDYLRILSDKGILNFNRWFDGDEPRETMRLFVMILDALREIGIERPWEHVIVGHDRQWGILLVRKTAFTQAEQVQMFQYFQARKSDCAYMPALAGQSAQLNVFGKYVAALQTQKAREFLDQSTWDISVVHDDSPFFYKYYRFNLLDTRGEFHPGGGSVAFYVQLVIIVQTAVFILGFIFLPLWIFKKKQLSGIERGRRLPFLAYFAALGLGFIFIEITLMQRFTLALGSPIYSVSVTLATLLTSSGLGSLLSERIATRAGGDKRLIAGASLAILVYLLLAVFVGSAVLHRVAGLAFAWRVVLSVLLLAPLGLCLGVYFPSGLVRVGLQSAEATVWAWGINSGFTVLGSTLSIVIAQFLGFNRLLLFAAALYALAYGCFTRLGVAFSTKGETASAAPMIDSA